MSLSFKVTLIQEDEQETRRFVLNEDRASRFSDLQQKIISIFPALGEREPVVSWLDDEGDEVRMANNEELKLALATMPGPVFKLRVRQGGKTEGEQQQAGELHPGIVCDGCDGPVLGPRYKCLACPDFDLCKNCEGRGLHSQHKMVRLPQPCKRDTRGLVRCPLMRASSSACNNEAMGMPDVFAELLATRPWAKGCQMKPTATATEKPEDKTEPKESSEAKNDEPGQKTENQANGEASKTATSSDDNPSSLPGLLADLTPLLGPIQAEQLSQLLTTFPGSQLQEQLPQLGGLISTFLGPAALEAVFPVLEALAKTQSVQSEAQQESEPEQKKTREGSLEKEKASKNTEAEKEKLEDMDVEKSDEENADSDFEVIPASSTRSSIYPTLPTDEQARLWKTNPMDSTNVDKEDKEGTESVTNADKKMSRQDDAEDPKVAGARAQMQAMGFSDDGGWLSDLLRAKSGDVGKVLYAIQPNRHQ
jgi:sequestosome 1